MKPLFLYIHIPYCHHRCPYCDFNTAVEANLPEDDYARAILNELDFYSERPEWSNRTGTTIYFGGGTPSIFSPKVYRRIIYSVKSRFKAAEDLEITLEANPNDLSFEVLDELFQSGINRLSIGAQSFNDQILKGLGRTHRAEEIINGTNNARRAGFKNISLDLIFGAPGHNLDLFREDLEALIALSPEHASLYSLTIEKGTEFYTRHAKGKLNLPKDDQVADMLDYGVFFLGRNGLLRYEVSNFARPNFESRHNSAYWSGESYLGLGAGAHSMLVDKDGTRVRWANIANPLIYIKASTENLERQAWSERVGGLDLGFEYLMLGLRTTKGVSLSTYEEVCGASLFDLHPGMVEVLEGSDFLRVEGDNLRLTDKGLAVADSVVENFIPESSKVAKSRA